MKKLFTTIAAPLKETFKRLLSKLNFCVYISAFTSETPIVGEFLHVSIYDKALTADFFYKKDPKSKEKGL